MAIIAITLRHEVVRMPWSARTFLAFLSVLVFSLNGFDARARAQAAAPNSDGVYQQLRNIQLSGEAVSVSNVTLHRDAGTFHLRSGTVCFLAPVQGKVTGAIFVGEGNFVLDPPIGVERRQLRLLTKDTE